MDRKAYKREWIHEKRLKTKDTKKRERLLISQGRCPLCEILLLEEPNHDCKRDWKFLK